MTRIAIVDAADGVGGAQLNVLAAAARFAASDCVVLGGEPLCALAREREIAAWRLPLPRLRTPIAGPARLLAGAAALRRTCRSLAADVLLATDVRAAVYALGAGALGGPPLVALVPQLLRRSTFVRALERRANAVVVPSAAAAAPFTSGRTLHVLPTGVDLARLRPQADRAEAKRRLGLPPHGIVVGTVGRADPSKGMATFVDAVEPLVAASDSTSAIVAGGAAFPHEREPYEALKRYARARLGSRCVLTGSVDDVAPILAAVDVFAWLGAAEALPTVVLEAMAAGAAVVAFAAGGVPEALEHERSGLLVGPGDVAGAGAALRRLVDDAELRRRLVTAARRSCEERFSLERFAAELEAVVVAAA